MLDDKDLRCLSDHCRDLSHCFLQMAQDIDGVNETLSKLMKECNDVKEMTFHQERTFNALSEVFTRHYD